MTAIEGLEYEKCAKDPVYFAKNHWHGIVAGELVKIPVYKFQEDIIRALHNNNHNIIKKSRQMYVSTTMAIYVTWCLIFKFDYAVAIISNKMEISNNFLNTVRRNLEYFRVGFKLENEIIIDNKSEIRLATGSSLRAFAANKGAGRGYSINMLIFDEAAYVNDLEYIWMGLGMATSAVNGKVVFASTPYKSGDLFHRIWVGAKKGENDFNSIHLDWTMNPRYTKDIEFKEGKAWSPWFEKMSEMLQHNEDSIDRELYGLFVSGVRPDVPKRINFRLESEVYDKIIEKIDKTGISLTDYMKELIKIDLGLE